jgi:phospholipase C
LSIPTLMIGGATYSSVEVTVGSIISGPTGTSSTGVEDSYDPASGQLTVEAVTVGSATYYNVAITVASLDSIGSIAGADAYNGTDLTISYVQVLGGALYTNVVVKGGSLISVAGGMPNRQVDSYNSQTGQLAIPAVVSNGRVYTNVTVEVGSIESMGPPGYVLRATPLSPGLVAAGNNSASTVAVIPANGYTGSVSLSCAMLSGGTPVPECSLNPAVVTLSGITPVPSALMVSTAADNPGGPYTFSVTASDMDKAGPANGPQLLKFTSMAVIQHVVIIFQENRTPDNLFHDPVLIARGADLASSGLNSLGQTIPLRPIDLGTSGSNPQNYGVHHTHAAFVSMYDGGKMDGADLIPCEPAAECPPKAHPSPQFMYVNPADVQPYFALAEQYTFGDRMFQTNQGPSFPAHQFIISGTSAPTATSPLFDAENPNNAPGLLSTIGCIGPPDRTVNMINATGSETNVAPQYPCFEHPTLTDLLDSHGVTWRYYTPSPGFIWTGPVAIQHMCLPQMIDGILSCTGPTWTDHVIIPQTQVLTDIANGKLAQVSWVIPTGLSSDHDRASDGSGPSWVASVVNAIGNSAYWANTAIIITWDDWGGWYDHVAPKVITDGVSWGSGYTYGFRVPLVIVSPYAKAAYISHIPHDFGSILKYIETSFALPSLGYADDPADDLSDCFDRTQAPLVFRTIPAPHPGAYFINDKRPPTDPDDD